MALKSVFTSFNLPVKNVEQSKAFFTKLGFELNPYCPENENSVAFESREKVDEIVNTAVSLGGKLHAEPEDYGSMYHWGFVDLDGHLWAINYMDMGTAQG